MKKLFLFTTLVMLLVVALGLAAGAVEGAPVELLPRNEDTQEGDFMPFETLEEALAAATPDDFLYIHSGDHALSDPAGVYDLYFYVLGGSLTVTAGSFPQVIYALETSRLTVTGGEINAIHAESAVKVSGGHIQWLYAADATAMEISGGIFESVDFPLDSVTAAITGGQFADNYSGDQLVHYLTDDYERVNLGNGYYVVQEVQDEAAWGSSAEELSFSGTLQQALQAAGSDSSIRYVRLLCNVTGEHIVVGANITLDLAGFTLTAQSYALDVREGAHVTVVDTAEEDGSIISTGDSAAALIVHEESTAVVEGGNFMGDIAGMGNDRSGTLIVKGGSFTGYRNTFQNLAQLTLEGGSFIAEDGEIILIGMGERATVTGIPCIGLTAESYGGVLDLSGHADPSGLKFISKTSCAVEDVLLLPDGYALLNSEYTVTTSLEEDGVYTVRSAEFDITELEKTSIVISMEDQYGDGWNGAAILILENGVHVATATMDFGSNDRYFYEGYDPEAEYVLQWLKGSYDDECSFTVSIAGEEVVRVVTGLCAIFENEQILYPVPDPITVTVDPGMGIGTMAPFVASAGFCVLPECTLEAPEGFIFMGWALSADGEILMDEYVAAEEDFTLYAIFEKVATVYVGSIPLHEGEYLPSMGTRPTQTAPASGGYIHYANGVLTLQDFIAIGRSADPLHREGGAVITLTDDVTVLLKGRNVIGTSIDGETAVHAAKGTVTVEGDGHLALFGIFGLVVQDGDLILKGGHLQIEYAGMYIAIACAGDVTVSGGEVIVTDAMFALRSDGNITVSGGVVRTAGASVLFDAKGAITVTGGLIECRDASHGLLGGSLTVSGGTVLLDVDVIGILCQGIVRIEGKDSFLAICSESESIYCESSSMDEHIVIGEELTLAPGNAQIFQNNNASIFVDENGDLVSNVVIAALQPAWGDGYVYDSTHHWHVCLAADCALPADHPAHRVLAGADYAPHSTEGSCVCGYGADDTSTLYIDDIPMKNGQYLTAYGNLTNEKPTTGGYAYFADGVLTLQDFVFSGKGTLYQTPEVNEAYALIYSTADLTIRLVGESLLIISMYENGYGIVVEGDLEIDGEAEATLSIVTFYSAINVKGGDVAIRNATLQLHSEAFDAIEVEEGSLTLENVMLNATGMEAIAVTGGNATVKDSRLALLSRMENDALLVEYGSILLENTLIDAAGSDTISTVDGDITVKGGTLHIFAINDGFDLTNGDLTLDGATVIIEAGDHAIEIDYVEAEEGEPAAPFKGNLYIEGGTLYTQSEDDGIDVELDIVIRGGSITVESEDIALDGGESITVSGGTLVLKTDTSWGLDCSELLTVTGGSIEIYYTGNALDNESALGIYAGDEVVMLGGELKISGFGGVLSTLQMLLGCTMEITSAGWEDAGGDYVYYVAAEDNTELIFTVGRKAGAAHTDADGNHVCDVCASAFPDCLDENSDHKCDLCGEKSFACTDADSDHKCDTCNAVASACADENGDHKCDICTAVVSTCADENGDHKCDICTAALSTCADENGDHKCDICTAALSTCADANGDHKCDICGVTVSEHAPGAWQSDAERHWKACACGARLEEAAHSYADGSCTACGLEAPKKSGAIWVILPAAAVVLGGGFALWYFLIRKKKIV